MAKGRMLQNRVSKSQKLASLSNDTVRLLYTWMLSHLDINGSFYADPVMVNNLVFTRLGHSIKTISAALDELVEKGLIIRFQDEGESYLNYPDFQEKQPKLYPEREGEPDIPKITPESLLNNSGVTRTQIKLKQSKVKERLFDESEKVELFKKFYEAYPRKVNKKEAFFRWKNANLPSLEIILSAIERQKKSEQWQRDYGKYIPYPSTWLNQERWNDEIDTKIIPAPSRPVQDQTNKCGNCGKGVRPGEVYCPECLLLRDSPMNTNVKELLNHIGKT
jgi:hypothetical protein